MNEANTAWLKNFRQRYGRSPTILHIGNIANNAYNNARLLNQAGFECDVICYDYYHTMACPEWEDAEFLAKFRNENHPEWWQVDLKGFQRPRWFAQGFFETCIRYLIAKRLDADKADTLWQLLSVQNGLAQKAKPRSIEISLWLHQLTRLRFRLKRLARALITAQTREVLGIFTSILELRMPKQLVKPMLMCLLVPILLIRIVGWPFKRLVARYNEETERKILEVLAVWKMEFPDRSDALLREDILPHIDVLATWKALLKNYDFVIGYSTDPLLPMLAGKPYYALEHGTIREIPYATTSIGRLCALSYRKALHVFVTNFDCVDSAKTLAPGRFTVINHPYDEDHGLAIRGTAESRDHLLQELDSNFLIFHPTRQDWVVGTGYADKSNDTLINAFIEMRRRGLKVGMVCCSWGKNVANTKALLTHAAVSQHVKWVAPLPITPFERMCRACDVVADQFKLGAFGGVCFKAMAVGAPILTYLNESLLLQQYPEVPPVINCEFSEEIVSRLGDLVARRDELERLGQASREWMKKYHGKTATVNAQVDQFRQHLLID